MKRLISVSTQIFQCLLGAMNYSSESVRRRSALVCVYDELVDLHG